MNVKSVADYLGKNVLGKSRSEKSRISVMQLIHRVERVGYAVCAEIYGFKRDIGICCGMSESYHNSELFTFLYEIKRARKFGCKSHSYFKSVCALYDFFHKPYVGKFKQRLVVSASFFVRQKRSLYVYAVVVYLCHKL